MDLDCKCERCLVFSFKSAWNIVRQQNPLFEFQKLIWYPFHCAKMAICLLRALQQRLPMKDKLVKYGIIQSNVCPLCTTSPENIDHLYFECEYAKHMWAICKLKLGLTQQVSSLENEARLIRNQFKSKNKNHCSCKLGHRSSGVACLEGKKFEDLQAS